MSKIIELTDEQYDLLKYLQNERLTQDNDYTDEPIWSVQNKTIRPANEDYDSIDGFWISWDDYFEEFFDKDLDDLKIILKDLLTEYTNNEKEYNFDDCDYFYEFENRTKEYGFDNISFGYFTTEYKDIAYFIVKKEAKNYMDYQKHNLKNPRTYAHGLGYANNSSIRNLLKLLKEINLKEI